MSMMTVGRLVSRASSTARVDRHRGRASAALGAEEHVGDAGLTGAGMRRVASRGRAPHRAVERLFHGTRSGRRAGRPRKELVRPGAHRLQNQVGFRGAGNREDRDARMSRPQAFDRRHPRRRIHANVHDNNVGTSARRVGHSTVHDANGYTARAQQLRNLPLELFIVADDGCCQLCHVGSTASLHFTSLIAIGKQSIGNI